jgi:hypothetical protein
MRVVHTLVLLLSTVPSEDVGGIEKQPLPSGVGGR